MEITKKEERRSIQINRLSYILYSIDNANEKDKNDIKKMFDTLLDVSFDSNGIIRSTKNLYDHLQNIMIDNGGNIPYFPDSNQIKNIDEKCKALKELDFDNFEIYRKKVEGILIKKGNKKDKKDTDDDILDPQDENKDLVKAFSAMEEMNPGFLNTLGISKKDDEKDKEKKSQNIQQLSDRQPKPAVKESLSEFLCRIFK